MNILTKKEEKMQLDHENEKHDMNICFKKLGLK